MAKVEWLAARVQVAVQVVTGVVAMQVVVQEVQVDRLVPQKTVCQTSRSREWQFGQIPAIVLRSSHFRSCLSL